METAGSSETVVSLRQARRRHIAEDGNFHLYGCYFDLSAHHVPHSSISFPQLSLMEEKLQYKLFAIL
jgi:hypothetical protein